VTGVAAPLVAPAPALEPPAGRPRFAGFDGLRAVAALAVVAVHVAAFSGVTTADGPVGAVTARLNVGVAIFFVISGFLLYRPYVAAARAGRPPMRLGDYARRRALRILPAYWVALTLLAIWPGLPGVFTGDWAIYYGLAQAYDPRTALGGIAPAWTLCIEVTFYALLPLYAAALRRLTAGRPARDAARIDLGVLAGLTAAVLVLRTAVHAATGEAVVLSTLPGMFDWFAGGMALAVLSVHGGGAVAGLGRRPWAAWAAALALLAVAAALPGTPRSYDPDEYPVAGFLAEHVLYLAIGVLAALPAIWGARGAIGVLRAPVLAGIGIVSYGLYLWHVPLLAELRDRGVDSWWALGSLGLAAALVCATASWVLVERPALRLRAPRRRVEAA
jgi:peptidoglycan/LPS O-acetylase OafA/YrhL